MDPYTTTLDYKTMDAAMKHLSDYRVTLIHERDEMAAQVETLRKRIVEIGETIEALCPF